MCILVGTNYVILNLKKNNILPGGNNQPYDHTELGENYNVKGFNYQDTIAAQTQLNLWLQCVEKLLGRSATFEFKRTGNPSIPANEPLPKAVR